MMANLKAELRKLLTVRTTYVMVGISILIVILFSFFIEGYHLSGKELLDRHLYTEDITGMLTAPPMILGAVIAILLMTHEYRYNTIMYTLTESGSRSKVLAAKLLVVGGFALVFTAFMCALSPLMSHLGIAMHGNTLAPQVFDWHSIVWRALFYGWGYIELALVLAVIIRNQIGAIMSLIIVPAVEQLFSLLLKHSSVYLPFVSLGSVVQHPEARLGTISYGRSAIVFGVYLIVGWIAAWLLFLKRDAN
jgi:ABC-2 type transport system permease protein